MTDEHKAQVRDDVMMAAYQALEDAGVEYGRASELAEQMADAAMAELRRLTDEKETP